MSAQAELNSEEMRNTKAEMAELKRMISRLQNEIQALKNQVRPGPQSRAEQIRSDLRPHLLLLLLILKL